MANKLVALLTILGAILGAALLYANTAYFPMDRGVIVEQKLEASQRSTDEKLERILLAVEKK